MPALSNKTVPDGLKMGCEVDKIPVNVIDIGNDRDIAAILQKPHKAPNAADIVADPECGSAIAAAVTPMSREAIDAQTVHAGYWNALSAEPEQKVT